MNGRPNEYFLWLIDHFESHDRNIKRLCRLLHNASFRRDVGLDSNRALNALGLRERFLDQSRLEVVEGLPSEATWFEMMLILSIDLNYIYEEGVLDLFLEMCSNLGLDDVLDATVSVNGTSIYDEVDQDYIYQSTARVDDNMIDSLGNGGLFPLRSNNHPDQRGVEIWEQAAAYFNEKLEGVMWTSTT